MQPVALTSDESISLAFDPPLAIRITRPDCRLRKQASPYSIYWQGSHSCVFRSQSIGVDQGTAPFDCEENEEKMHFSLFLFNSSPFQSIKQCHYFASTLGSASGECFVKWFLASEPFLQMLGRSVIDHRHILHTTKHASSYGHIVTRRRMVTTYQHVIINFEQS